MLNRHYIIPHFAPAPPPFRSNHTPISLQPQPHFAPAPLTDPFLQVLDEVCSTLDLYDLNYVLYRCNDEERVDGCGGVYGVPGYGDLVYAGLVGKQGRVPV